MKKLFISLVLTCCTALLVHAKNYYFNIEKGNDKNSGLSIKSPFKSLKKIGSLNLKPGDSILLANGSVFKESLILSDVQGNAKSNIVISNYATQSREIAKIDAKGFANAVFLENCSFIEVQNL